MAKLHRGLARGYSTAGRGLAMARRRGAPPCSVLGPRGRYELPHLAQKDQEEMLMLTEGSDRAGVTCRGVDGEVRRRGSILRTRTGHCRDAPDSRAPQVDSRNTCGGATGVREVR